MVKQRTPEKTLVMASEVLISSGFRGLGERVATIAGEYPRKENEMTTEKKSVRVRIAMTVEIDTAAWSAVAGEEMSPSEVRADVQAFARTTVMEELSDQGVLAR